MRGPTFSTPLLYSLYRASSPHHSTRTIAVLRDMNFLAEETAEKTFFCHPYIATSRTQRGPRVRSLDNLAHRHLELGNSCVSGCTGWTCCDRSFFSLKEVAEQQA
ncbi:hypothetical protein TGME49_279345 [Toxoplasma gondii ME49]|uniref:Uncharacterized protein n=2 Tax=Toxoplasma gondii TaxID=5811 RepID=S8GGC6_TOXGM|nr:hypothetical protein TGME49_279345 [Toxoplasma gondii ME49]EPT27529.1 hypothetical protein TGME49_279345 [Toxoplasma gondii ME49]KYF45674.1 hypothetical protein TGARI_279345 [Toxoplasma gondii ARI]|eukprot:XP_018636208.1 hypothetical protein TGME49_279345 [Toxoplasma gondii ME49]